MRPPLDGILETAVYCSDLEKVAEFYEKVFGFSRLFADARLVAFDIGGRQVLLLFKEGATTNDFTLPNGDVIPAHDGRGKTHFAFQIPKDQFDTWIAWLAEIDVPVTSIVNWTKGGQSLYFDDPEGHLVELATPGLWWA